MKRELLLERDFLLFDGWDAINLQGEEAIKFRKSSAIGLTLRVYGSIGISDLTGEKTIHDMQVMLGDCDIYGSLPDSFLQTLVHEAVES